MSEDVGVAKWQKVDKDDSIYKAGMYTTKPIHIFFSMRIFGQKNVRRFHTYLFTLQLSSLPCFNTVWCMLQLHSIRSQFSHGFL